MRLLSFCLLLICAIGVATSEQAESAASTQRVTSVLFRCGVGPEELSAAGCDRVIAETIIQSLLSSDSLLSEIEDLEEQAVVLKQQLRDIRNHYRSHPGEATSGVNREAGFETEIADLKEQTDLAIRQLHALVASHLPVSDLIAARIFSTEEFMKRIPPVWRPAVSTEEDARELAAALSEQRAAAASGGTIPSNSLATIVYAEAQPGVSDARARYQNHVLDVTIYFLGVMASTEN